MPIGLITRATTKKLKEALDELVRNIWSKMDLGELGTSKEHEGQALIHLIQVSEEPIPADANLMIKWSRNPHAKTSIPEKPSTSSLIGV